MHRTQRFLILAATLALFCAPRPARAETWIAPFTGVIFGSNNADHGKSAVGVDVGGISGGPIGAEVDFGYLPHFFGDTATFGSNYLLDLTGNVLLAAPGSVVGPGGIRPFASLGLGFIHSHADGLAGLGSFSNNDTAISAGFGAIGYFSKHAGLRGDFRYFRSVYHNDDISTANFDLGGLHFWRASIGLVLR